MVIATAATQDAASIVATAFTLAFGNAYTLVCSAIEPFIACAATSFTAVCTALFVVAVGATSFTQPIQAGQGGAVAISALATVSTTAVVATLFVVAVWDALTLSPDTVEIVATFSAAPAASVVAALFALAIRNAHALTVLTAGAGFTGATVSTTTIVATCVFTAIWSAYVR